MVRVGTNAKHKYNFYRISRLGTKPKPGIINLENLNQCAEYRKTIDFFIKTKGLHNYFERNGGSLDKAIANANRSMDEVQKDGRDYTYSELGRLMKELKELEVV